MVDENDNFVHGANAGNQQKKRSAFDAANLKGRPLL